MRFTMRSYSCGNDVSTFLKLWIVIVSLGVYRFDYGFQAHFAYGHVSFLGISGVFVPLIRVLIVFANNCSPSLALIINVIRQNLALRRFLVGTNNI